MALALKNVPALIFIEIDAADQSAAARASASASGGRDGRRAQRHRDTLVLCQTEFEVLSTGLSLPHRHHRRRKAGLNSHYFHRDEPRAISTLKFEIPRVFQR
jgi:hypothetical protein